MRTGRQPCDSIKRMSARAVGRSSSVLISAALLVCGAGCGGGSKSTSSGTPSAVSGAASARSGASGATTTSSAASSAPTGKQQVRGSTVTATANGLHVSLRAQNHAPKAGTPWHYAVHAADAAGHPADGTVETEFAFGAQVVGREAPPTHRLKQGRLLDNVTFPSRSIGFPLTFRVVVHTNLGSATLDWPIKVTA